MATPGRTTPSGIRPPSAASMHGVHLLSSPMAATAPGPASSGSGNGSGGNSHSNSNSNSTSVQVALRIRPPPSSETASASSIPHRFQRSVVHPSPGSSTQLSVEAPPVGGGKGPARQSFAFDRVVGPQDGQASVYEVVEPLVNRFLEGYNVTVLAYGQTSSGKSYTMGTDLAAISSSPSQSNDSDISGNDAGGVERAGIIPRAVGQIFDEIAKRTKEGNGRWKVEARNSYVEIYNEDLIDLLVGDVEPEDRPAITIREDKAGHIIWSGLREVKVKNGQEVMRNLEAGSAIRQTGSTAMNDQSSRSHAIFSLTLTQRRWAGQGSPKSTSADPASSHTTPPLAQANGPFSTPSRAAARHSALPSRVGSPTPGAMGSPAVGRPGTPGDTRPGSRLLPRPASSLGLNVRSPSTPGASAHEEDSKAGDSGEWTIVTSKFHWVDLAGSERLKRTSAVGDRAKEGISINAGLLALGNVISALGDPVKARQTTHIPYRDSKLTRLLQDSPGGNAHTLMIACVSPVEYNLSETLNTLKYAHRARNIKNKAELNEIEAGWDDVDHLQQLVTRLRSELTILRHGGAAMPAISEELGGMGPLKSPGLGSSELLRLQDQYADLSTRYAKLTAELAKSQASATSSPVTMSPESFAMAVEPVVEEYEKSISALESQLSLTKAALSHSEEMMREQSEKISLEGQLSENSAKIIGDLKIRLAKLTEREAVTEGYVRDLETRLKSSTEHDEANAALLLDLKKEITKYREVESNTEQYIKELEARLAKSEETQHLQKGQIDNLEREVQRRERAYEELESRLSLLDTSEQHKQLLFELDERDKRLIDIQSELEQAKLQMSALEADLGKMKAGAEQDAIDKKGLHRRIESLENKPTVAVMNPQGKVEPASSAPSTATATDSSLTPPQTPLRDGEEDPASVQSLESLTSKLVDLQAKHDAAVKNLESLSEKYKESLKQVETLQSTQRIRHRKGSSSASSASSPEVQTESLDDVVEELQDTARKSSLSPVGGSYITPTRAPRSSTRRSMPLSPRGSFLGRTPVTTHSASHLRSASLSQEFSLAQSLNGALPSLATNSSSAGPSGNAYAYGSLPSPTVAHHSPLMLPPPHSSMSPRPTSPMLGRRESLLYNGEMPSMPQHERSNESLLQEVKKLQDTLNEREEEIRELETSMAQLKGKQSAAPCSVDATNSLGLPTERMHFTASESLRTPDASIRPDPLSLSPNTLAAFNAIKASMDHASEVPAEDGSTEVQMARLDDLMLSMAKKEVAHQSKVDELEDQLGSLRKQHDELKALSKDQVLNMSTEIAALREQLGENGAKNKTWEEKLAKMDAEIKAKGEEVETLLREQADAHDAALEALKKDQEDVLAEQRAQHEQAMEELHAEHAALLRRMLEAKEELFMRKAEEYDAALQKLTREHQETLKSKDFMHEEALKAAENDQVEALKRRDLEHGEALERSALQQSTSSASDQASLLESLNEQHAKALKAREEAREEAEQRLKSEHARIMGVRQQEHAAATKSMQEEHDSTLTRLFEDHSQALQEVRDERDSLVKKAADDHAQKVADIRQAHSQDLEELRQSHGQAQDALQREMASQSERHADEVAEVRRLEEEKKDEAMQAQKDEHEAALRALESKHQDALAQLEVKQKESIVALEATHAAALVSLKADYDAQVLKLQESESSGANDRFTATIAEHTRMVDELRSAHEQSLAQIAQTHNAATTKLIAAHESELAACGNEHGRKLTLLQQVQTQELSRLEGQLVQATRAQEKMAFELEEALAQVKEKSAEASKHQRTVSDLQRSAMQQTGLQSEVERLQRVIDTMRKSEDALGTELQESVDALGTMEKALTDSQDERERLQSELSDLKKDKAAALASAATIEKELQAQIATLKEEKEALKSDIARLNTMSPSKRPLSPHVQQGLGINGFGSHRDSKDQETLLRIHTGHGDNTSSDSIYPIAKHSSVVSLVNGSMPHSRPPPTPPPSMPPPPLPTEALYNNHNGSVSSHAGHSGLNGAGASTSSNKTRESVSSVFTRDSHMDTASVTGTMTNRTNSIADGAYNRDTVISVDPRVHQKFEEQEAALTRLTKRLEHAETELKANIDLVTTLESALNDSERNLRKARINMNDMSKERDGYRNQNESLRNQVIEGQRAVDTARHQLAMHEEESRSRLEAQKRAQREAQTHAEARMAEIQRLNRKSKFNCF